MNSNADTGCPARSRLVTGWRSSDSIGSVPREKKQLPSGGWAPGNTTDSNRLKSRIYIASPDLNWSRSDLTRIVIILCILNSSHADLWHVLSYITSDNRRLQLNFSCTKVESPRPRTSVRCSHLERESNYSRFCPNHVCTF